jgi:hypothetical protein
MITASDVFNDVKSFLDDDSSGRYSEPADLVPAINNAVLYLVAVFNSAFEQKKISPESLRDLSVVKILPVTGTATKKADISSITDLWTIFGIEADPAISGSPGVLSESRNKFATRMTLENWNDSLADPFSAGTGVSIPSEFIRPGYLGPGAYFGDGKLYILIRPAAAFTADYVAIWYLKNPSKVATGASVIEFPTSLHGLLTQKTLNYLSMQHEGSGGYKSASDTKYGSITDSEIKQLVSLMLS